MLTAMYPGVYLQEDATPAISINHGATAVPLFIAPFLPVDESNVGKIVRISGWLEYLELFKAETYFVTVRVTSELMGDSPEGASKKSKEAASEFYRYNLNTAEYIASTASESLWLYFKNGGGACYLYSSKKGDKNEFDKLPDLINEVEGITLLACLENKHEYAQAVYSSLSGLLEQDKGYFMLVDTYTGDTPDSVKGSSHVAVYGPEVILSEGRAKISDENVIIEGYCDSKNNQMVTLSELRNVNPELATLVANKISAEPLPEVRVRASGVMAGVYCKVDRERGVWKAPANVEISGVRDLTRRFTIPELEERQKRGVNVIRVLSQRGIVIYGARTQSNDDNWRYISVRRLFDSAQRDIKKAIRPMLFEPNNSLTWKRVYSAIDNYLYNLWKQGALLGDKPEKAYFIQVGEGSTMTQDDINQGKMIVKIGMAAVRPAEFIILQFTQDRAL